eukprot:CAMPEP_0174361646 /NCGR_PEP_ID=MMETSP0811_2-20130205/60167_1 /TAXON_ID=73025 ORGANISM="Eutreptiella gymnastica-like, Strain CCMP1594" /NCGR_SAMPLE_ID=MMETSP0811_2 /ASSEMBLY_ACC=CAM_ASM_000667 /LENGTH=68 /DNA_ID=CAMNT_0015498455 /DNA_START=751 /DNA_END=954 /DNA_ORIENTATION=+
MEWCLLHVPRGHLGVRIGHPFDPTGTRVNILEDKSAGATNLGIPVAETSNSDDQAVQMLDGREATGKW